MNPPPVYKSASLAGRLAWGLRVKLQQIRRMHPWQK